MVLVLGGRSLTAAAVVAPCCDPHECIVGIVGGISFETVQFVPVTSTFEGMKLRCLC
jgi:hypothetical protein